MKKKYLYTMMLALGISFTACDPDTIEGTDDWSSVSAEQLKLSAKPIKVGEMNSNEIIVENNSGINSQWIAPQIIENSTVTPTAYGKIYVTKIGDIDITFHGLNNNEMIEKKMTVHIDTITYFTDELKRRLCIGKDNAPKYFGTTYNKAKIEFTQTMCEDGKGGNSITIKSNVNPVLCKFKWGSGEMDTNVGKLTTYDLGQDMDLTVDIVTAAGKTETITLGTFSAEDYSDFPDAIRQLTGYHPKDSPDATKTWTLANDGKQWGNGSYGDKTASWWTTTVDGQKGSNGKMTFDFKANTIKTVLDNDGNDKGDKSGEGKFVMDFSTASGNIICSIRTSGNGNVIFPFIINEDNVVTHKFEITSINDDEMWLSAQHTDPSNGEGTFWHFIAVK